MQLLPRSAVQTDTLMQKREKTTRLLSFAFIVSFLWFSGLKIKTCTCINRLKPEISVKRCQNTEHGLLQKCIYLFFDNFHFLILLRLKARSCFCFESCCDKGLQLMLGYINTDSSKDPTVFVLLVPFQQIILLAWMYRLSKKFVILSILLVCCLELIHGACAAYRCSSLTELSGKPGFPSLHPNIVTSGSNTSGCMSLVLEYGLLHCD